MAVSARRAPNPGAPTSRTPARVDAGPGPGPAPALWPWWVWPLVLAAVIAASIWFVHWSGMRPSFDPFGWLTWGHQLLYGRLDLNAAPSWKPLTIIFTLPFSLFGGTSVSMWSVTSTAGTLLMGVFAARIVYRLTDDVRARPDAGRWVIAAAWIGALFAGIGVLGMAGLPKLTYIANSDQLNTALVLAAIDAHLSRRPRLAYLTLFLASLGRPEVWALSGVYGLWLIWKVPGTRILVVGGWVLIIAAWYVPDYVWANSINEASKLDLNKASACTGNSVVCVIRRWGPNLYAWPMGVAALIGLVAALVSRNRRVLLLLGTVAVWLIVEIAFAYKGLSAVSRYLMESTAVMVVVAGWGIAELLSGLPGVLRRAPVRAVQIVGVLVLLGLLVGFEPSAHVRLYKWRDGADHARAEGRVNVNMSRAVAAAGGPAHILACGRPAALNQHQSQLAWALNLNDANVLFNPPLLKRLHTNFVLFTQAGQRWTVKAYNVPANAPGYCATLGTRHA